MGFVVVSNLDKILVERNVVDSNTVKSEVGLTPEQIKKGVDDLQEEYVRLCNLVEITHAQMVDVGRRISALRTECLHGEVRVLFLQDVAEMKLQRFCAICGERR